MPIKPAVVCLVLTELDNISDHDRTTKYGSTKDQQSSFWRMVTQHHKVNLTSSDSQQNHIPFEKRISSHNDDELRRSFGYTIRDQKREEYASLKGDQAMTAFFRLGSKMLKWVYLEKIGYLQIADDGELATPTTLRAMDGSHEARSAAENAFTPVNFRSWSPQSSRKRAWDMTHVDSIDDHDFASSSDIATPTPAARFKSRKIQHKEPSPPAIPTPNIIDHQARDLFSTLREVLNKAISCISISEQQQQKNMGKLLFATTSIPFDLERLCHCAFGIDSWRDHVREWTAQGQMTFHNLLGCLIWAFLDTEIFSSSSSSSSRVASARFRNLTEDERSGGLNSTQGFAQAIPLTQFLVIVLADLMTQGEWRDRPNDQELFESYLLEICEMAIRLQRLAVAADERVSLLRPLPGQRAYVGAPGLASAVGEWKTVEDRVLFTKVPGLVVRVGEEKRVVVMAELEVRDEVGGM